MTRTEFIQLLIEDARMGTNYDEIDPLIRDLIRELNAAGHETFSSCQGWTEPSDVNEDESGHCLHAFISFSDPDMLPKIRKKVRRHGLYIYNGGFSLTAIDDCHLGDNATVFALNKDFPNKVRKLFGLEAK